MQSKLGEMLTLYVRHGFHLRISEEEVFLTLSIVKYFVKHFITFFLIREY